jgi:hypothetical protein
MFLSLCLAVGSVLGFFLRKALYVEGCYYVSILLSVFLSLRAGSTSFRYQIVCAIYLEIITPHL